MAAPYLWCREGLDWICGPCLVDINGASAEEDNTDIDQLGEYVVPLLITGVTGNKDGIVLTGMAAVELF